VIAQRGELARGVGDANVLATSVDTSIRGERRGVLTDEHNPARHRNSFARSSGKRPTHSPSPAA